MSIKKENVCHLLIKSYKKYCQRSNAHSDMIGESSNTIVTHKHKNRKKSIKIEAITSSRYRHTL